MSQAIKNHGRLNPAGEDIETKIESWDAFYRNDNVETSIQRIIGETAATLRLKLTNVLLSPDTTRRVFIVTSS